MFFNTEMIYRAVEAEYGSMGDFVREEFQSWLGHLTDEAYSQGESAATIAMWGD